MVNLVNTMNFMNLMNTLNKKNTVNMLNLGNMVNLVNSMNSIVKSALRDIFRHRRITGGNGYDDLKVVETKSNIRFFTFPFFHKVFHKQLQRE